MRFFFDNCIAPAYAEAIAALTRGEGHEVVHLTEKFRPDADDVEWMGQLAREGDWIVISGDPAITRKKHEQAAWLESRLTAFFLAEAWQNLKFWDQAWQLIRKWPLIAELAGRVEPGAGFLVKVKSNRLEQIRIK